MVQAQFGSVALVQLSSDHTKSHTFFVYNLLEKSDRTMRLASLRSARQDESIDMYIRLAFF